MATTSQTKAGLDEISTQITQAIAEASAAKSQLQSAKDRLTGLTTTYSDVISSITAYKDADDYEKVSKAELTRLTAEFVALKAALTTAINAI